MTHELTHLDLFSGIGGFALAASWAGFRTIGFSEIEPYACRIIAERWPGVPNVGDVRTTANFARFRGCTVLTGGFPCQPWSSAGQRRGANDDRHLWPAMLRVIETVGPTWVIGENVPGLDHLGQLDACIDDLEGIGYESQPFEIPACAVDAPHRRARIWIVAHTIKRGIRHNDQSREASLIFSGETLADSKRPKRRAQREALRRHSKIDRIPQGEESPIGTGGGCQTLGDSDFSRLEIGKSQPSDDGQKLPTAQRTGLGGRAICGGRWLPEPGMGRVANGVPDRSHRLKGLGNAIVPQIPEALLTWIAQIEQGTLTA